MFCSYRQACESEFQMNTAIFKITNARNMSTRIATQNQCQQKCKETRCNQCNFYAITVTSKFGIPSSSAKQYHANVHRTQLSHTDSNEVYVH